MVPYRPDGGWRDRLWAWNRARWERYAPDCQLVVGVEPDPTGLFCAASAMNDAATQATGDILVTTSCDFIADPSAVQTAVDTIESGAAPWVALYGRTAFLDETSTRALLEDGDDVELVAEQVVGVNNAVYAFPRGLWDDVGGIDERFRGWGPEDMALRAAMLTLHPGALVLANTCLHLWHPRRETGAEAAVSVENHRFFDDTYGAAIGNVDAMRGVVEAAKESRRVKVLV